MLQIIKPGLLDTLQDAGRFGFAACGINPNGVMDTYAMKVANALTANEPNEAVLEMHFPAPVIQFEEPALIALSGADFSAMIDGTEIPINKPVMVPKGAMLSFQKRISGSRCYLSVQGGFALKPWLDSLSTNLVANTGGINGQKLAKDDTIPFRKAFNIDYLKVLPWRADSASAYKDSHYLYFLKGPEWDWMNAASQHQMLAEAFTVSPQSDRMAIRLQGEKLESERTEGLVSSAVTRGTLQLLPSGEVLVLMADHQTTGGYPRIGNIISAHLPKLAQAKAGDYIHLLHVEQPVAEEIGFLQQEELNILRTACAYKWQSYTL